MCGRTPTNKVKSLMVKRRYRKDLTKAGLRRDAAHKRDATHRRDATFIRSQ